MSKGPEISEENRRKLQWMLPTIFIVMVALIAVAGRSGDPWYEKILTFQGLITGIFAIMAARLTVQQMKHSDEKAEKRHQQLVALNLRSEALVVQRACYPSIADGIEFAARIKLLNENLARVVAGQEFSKDRLNEMWNELTKITKEAEQLPNRQELTDVLDLMDTGGFQALKKIRSAAENLKDLTLARKVAGGSEWHERIEWFMLPHQVISETLTDLLVGVTFLVAELQILEDAFAGIQTRPENQPHS